MESSEAILISSSDGFWRNSLGGFPETKLISSDRRLCNPEGRVASGNNTILCTSFGYIGGRYTWESVRQGALSGARDWYLRGKWVHGGLGFRGP